jgi:apolipoprotein D and lipocalin family protein
MKNGKTALLVTGAALIGGAALARCWCKGQRPVGNPSVPEPSKPVDLGRYLGRWHEFARYENRFEYGDEAVTAFYSLRRDGLVNVVNRGRQNGLDGAPRVAKGRAKVVLGARGTKLKVSFFGPFFLGDYWILDHADDYGWSIVGEPSGKYLWILTRDAVPSIELGETLMHRAAELGYDTSLLRKTRQRAASDSRS